MIDYDKEYRKAYENLVMSGVDPDEAEVLAQDMADEARDSYEPEDIDYDWFI